MPYYSFAGLHLDSEGELPLPTSLPVPTENSETSETSDTSPNPVLRLRYRTFELEDQKLNQEAGGLSWGKFEHAFGLRVGKIDFLYQGDLLEVNTPFETAADFLVRAALGFVAVARGFCAFHGSAAGKNGKAVLIVGNKGAGKSTTVTGLLQRGWGLLCDDLVAVRQGWVHPTVLQTRLLPDSWKALGGSLQAVPGADGKISWSFGASHPALLGGAVVLQPGEEFATQEIHGHRKLQLLLPHLNHLPGVGDPAQRLTEAAEVVNTLRVRLVTRPVQRLALSEVQDTIEDLIFT